MNQPTNRQTEGQTDPYNVLLTTKNFRLKLIIPVNGAVALGKKS